MSTTEHRDWFHWHDAYADSTSDLSRRLAVVQSEIRAALPDREPTEPFRIVSLCAGQGHDVTGALADYPYADKVSGRLVELNDRNVELIRAQAHEAGLDHLEVVQGDAANTALYVGATPADLVLAVGIFGNISDVDIYSTIRALPQFCAPGAALLWSRGRRLPDIRENILETFEEAGFEHARLHAPEDANFQVGVERYRGEPRKLEPGHLFTFIR